MSKTIDLQIQDMILCFAADSYWFSKTKDELYAEAIADRLDHIINLMIENPDFDPYSFIDSTVPDVAGVGLLVYLQANMGLDRELESVLNDPIVIDSLDKSSSLKETVLDAIIIITDLYDLTPSESVFKVVRSFTSQSSSLIAQEVAAQFLISFGQPVSENLNSLN